MIHLFWMVEDLSQDNFCMIHFRILYIRSNFNTWISSFYTKIVRLKDLNWSSSNNFWHVYKFWPNCLTRTQHMEDFNGKFKMNDEKRTVLCLFASNIFVLRHSLLRFSAIVKQINYKMYYHLHPYQYCLVLMHTITLNLAQST